MPIAGAVVVPAGEKCEKKLTRRLATLDQVSIEGVGDKGIAMTLESDTMDSLRELSDLIGEWEEVLEVQLAYVNWEDLVDES